MQNELELKYGCNPNQKPAKIYVDNANLPIEVLNGKPGYINFLDALNGWQLVSELREALGYPAAASFKHVSPAGAAIGKPLTPVLRDIFFVDQKAELSALACAYARARGTDRMSSFGDWIALSDCCDASVAKLIQHEVSDGIIAPDYTDEALQILKGKRKGSYNIVKIDANYKPDPIERKQVYGITFEQGRNDYKVDKSIFNNIITKNKDLTDEAIDDLILALITLKYTQSNSVCYTYNGQTIGVGAGQQSRIHCTRLAGMKADSFFLRQHPKVLSLPFRKDIPIPNRDNAIDLYISEYAEDILGDDNWEETFTKQPMPLTTAEKMHFIAQQSGVSLGSDAFFPFGDNIERAYRSGVSFIAQPGGSIRDEQVISTCDKFKIAMAFTGMRLFHH